MRQRLLKTIPPRVWIAFETKLPETIKESLSSLVSWLGFACSRLFGEQERGSELGRRRWTSTANLHDSRFIEALMRGKARR